MLIERQTDGRDRYLCFIAEVTAEYKGELRKYRQTSVLKSSYATKNPKKFPLILRLDLSRTC